MSSKNVVLSLLCAIMLVCYSLCALISQPGVATVAQRDGIRLPIVMYHLVLDDDKRLGKFIVSPDELRRDMQYLKDKGYTTVVFADLVNYVENGAPLPEKPIMLTFDDGYYNNFLFAYPILKEFGFKAVLSVIGIQSEKYSQSGERSKYYSHMTWEDIKQSSDVFEIQNHSYNLHSFDKSRSGAKKQKGEGKDAYRKMLYDDLIKNQRIIKENTGTDAFVFTFPFGSMCEDAHEVVRDKLGYKGSLSCEEGINFITRDKECLYKLKRYNRADGKSSEEFFAFAP